jgi:hypothetical protein
MASSPVSAWVAPQMSESKAFPFGFKGLPV